MSDLISGKEAKLAWANGDVVEYFVNDSKLWYTITNSNVLGTFDRSDFKFRLKPKTVNLNGVEVGLLTSSEWTVDHPNRVVIEFKSRDDAVKFQQNAMKIFNGI